MDKAICTLNGPRLAPRDNNVGLLSFTQRRLELLICLLGRTHRNRWFLDCLPGLTHRDIVALIQVLERSRGLEPLI